MDLNLLSQRANSNTKSLYHPQNQKNLSIIYFEAQMYLTCLQHIEEQAKNVILYSARGIFHTGKYNECIATQGMNYNLLLFADNKTGAAGINSALCLPVDCSADMIKVALDTLLDKAGLPYYVATVVNDSQTYRYPFDARFFFTIFLFVMLTLLVLLASCSKSFEHHPTIGAFSVKKSIKIFQYNSNSRLNVFNGVKALAMMWVIFGHEYSLSFYFVVNTLTVEKNQLSGWTTLLQLAGLFAVDTFFFVGGFLVAYAVLRETTKSLLKYPLAVFNRYLRFLPSYLMAILIFSSLLMHLASGPYLAINEPTIRDCSSLWRPLLFVDNLVQNGDHMCMGWGWYLQNDMQMFIFSMFLLLIYQKSRIWCFITTYMSVAFSFAYTMSQTFNHQYKNQTHLSDFANSAQYQLDLYYKPWSRCPPYFYGLLLGILYHQFLMEEKKGQEGQHIFLKLKTMLEERPWFRRIFEFVGIILGLFICFIPRTAQGDHYWPQLAHSLYLTYGKLFFVFSLSIIILPSLLCDIGKMDSWIRFILDTKFFNFVGKVSFWTYLIHLTVIIHYFMTRTSDSYTRFQTIYPIFVAHTVISIVLGFMMVLLVESPFAKLQKKFIHKLTTNMREKSKQKQQAKKINQQKCQKVELNSTTEGSMLPDKDEPKSNS